MKKGFTLIEIVVSISVLIILATITTSAFSSFREKQALNSDIEQISVLLNDARFKTIASEDSSQYGVYFETNRAVFFKGAVFNEEDPDNKEILFSKLTQISLISLNGGGPDVVFKKLSGETDQHGFVTVSLRGDPSHFKNINIGASGFVGIDF